MNFDEYEPPAVGTRFDVGTTAIEYVGEYYFDYVSPTEDEESDHILVNSDTSATFTLTESDFQWIDGSSPLKGNYHGIWHSTINSGYLIRLTDDGEGAFLFHHWGL